MDNPAKKPRLLISACLCGRACRYDGKSFDFPALRQLAEDGVAIPFCAECAGGLPTPRPPCEIVGERVLTADARDRTAEYRRGAERAVTLCREQELVAAILKDGSPSCGVTRIYDGSHSGRRIPGMGLTARALAAAGIRLYSEENLPPELMAEAEGTKGP